MRPRPTQPSSGAGDPLLTAPALGSGVSAEVVDVASGDVAARPRRRRPRHPRVHRQAADRRRGADHARPRPTPWTTTVVAGATPGEVVLVGGGDPTLSRTAPRQTYPGAPDGGRPRHPGRRRHAGRHPGDPGRRRQLAVQRPAHRRGWGPADAPSSYAAPVTATAVDGARVSPARRPAAASPDWTPVRRWPTRSARPAPPSSSAQAPAGAETLATVESAPIARLVEQTLSMSDNMLAEALARQVAIARGQPASFDGAAQAVLAALADAGVDVTGVTLADGSGLSREDQVPAGVLRLGRRRRRRQPRRRRALLSGLPVAGYDGTLVDRGDDDRPPRRAPSAPRRAP